MNLLSYSGLWYILLPLILVALMSGYSSGNSGEWSIQYNTLYTYKHSDVEFFIIFFCQNSAPYDVHMDLSLSLLSLLLLCFLAVYRTDTPVFNFVMYIHVHPTTRHTRNSNVWFSCPTQTQPARIFHIRQISANFDTHVHVHLAIRYWSSPYFLTVYRTETPLFEFHIYVRLHPLQDIHAIVMYGFPVQIR